jgi:ribosome modulation factor
MKDRAYYQGYEAASSKSPREADRWLDAFVIKRLCPYKERSRLYQSWLNGWQDRKLH